MQPYPTADKINNFIKAKKKNIGVAILRKSTTRLSEERLFSVIFMNIELRKVKEIAHWTYHSKLELLESCFGHQLSCAIFMNIGLRNCKMNIFSKLEPFERRFWHQLSCVSFMSVGLNKIKKLWTEFIK